MPISALPLPTPEEVRQFAALYERKFGVVLDEKQAWEAATRTLRLFCLVTYGWPGAQKPIPSQDITPQQDSPPALPGSKAPHPL
jgi:hypothetical protein